MAEQKAKIKWNPSALVLQLMSQVPIFKELDREELKTLAEYMTYMKLRSGDILFKEWDDSNYVCFIVSGSMDIIKQAGPDKEVVLGTLHEGQTIGEMALIENLPRSATARTPEETTLVILSNDAFDRIFDKYPRITNRILKGIALMLSENLRRTSNQLAQYLAPRT